MSKQFYIKQFSLVLVQFMLKTVPFQIIRFSIRSQFKCKKSLSKTFLFQIFRPSHAVSSIQPIDRTLSGATIPGQSGPGNNGNKGVLPIPKSSSTTTETSVSECLVLYHLLGLTSLQTCSRCILLP